MSTGSSKSPLISIVDDDPFVRQATDSLLQSLGYRTSTFASAEDFLRSSYIHEMNCLISDVQMPGLSGVDLQRVLIAQGNHMPTIFISAYFEERIRQSVIEAGAIGYLRKPFDDESLIELLQWALGGEWTFGNCSRNRMSAIQRIQELDWERTTLFEQAKQEAPLSGRLPERNNISALAASLAYCRRELAADRFRLAADSGHFRTHAPRRTS
jgi:FixJ family two-component response regulator